MILESGLNLGQDIELVDFETGEFNEIWNPIFGELSQIKNNYKSLNVSLRKDNIKFQIIFRIYNDGVAFKYVIPNQDAIQNYNIIDEYSEFNLSSDDTAWWIPAFSYRRYEFLYAESKIDKISKKYFSENVEDISYDTLGIDAAHTPLTIKKNNGYLTSEVDGSVTNEIQTLSISGSNLITIFCAPSALFSHSAVIVARPSLRILVG